MANPSKKLPTLKKNPSGPTKAKAIGKANPVTPADRSVPWGAKMAPLPKPRPNPSKKTK